MNLHDDFTSILHDFTFTLLTKTAQHVDTKVQDVETKDNPLKLTAFSY